MPILFVVAVPVVGCWCVGAVITLTYRALRLLVLGCVAVPVILWLLLSGLASQSARPVVATMAFLTCVALAPAVFLCVVCRFTVLVPVLWLLDLLVRFVVALVSYVVAGVFCGFAVPFCVVVPFLVACRAGRQELRVA